MTMMSDRVFRTERETVQGRIQRRKRQRHSRRSLTAISAVGASLAISVLLVSVYTLPLSELEVSLVNNAPSSVTVAVYDGEELLSVSEIGPLSSRVDSYHVLAGSHALAAKISYSGDIEPGQPYDYSEEIALGFLGNRVVEIVLDDYY